MTGNQLREALHRGIRAYGTCLTNPSPWAISHYTQLDFAFIDNEHNPLGREATHGLCQVLKAAGIAPVVRIPVADPILASMALDAGAEGIICPYVEEPDNVREMVGAVKYRPLKGRKLDQFLSEGKGIDARTRQYLEEWNRNSVLIINVESASALERIDQLVAVKGLDAVLIGPHDLTISLDIPEQYGHPDFQAAVSTIITSARRAGIGAGLHYWADVGQELDYIRQGVNLIVHSTDITEAARSINNAMAVLRSTLGDEASRGSASTPAV